MMFEELFICLALHINHKTIHENKNDGLNILEDPVFEAP